MVHHRLHDLVPRLVTAEPGAPPRYIDCVARQRENLVCNAEFEADVESGVSGCCACHAQLIRRELTSMCGLIRFQRDQGIENLLTSTVPASRTRWVAVNLETPGQGRQRIRERREHRHVARTLVRCLLKQLYLALA